MGNQGLSRMHSPHTSLQECTARSEARAVVPKPLRIRSKSKGDLRVLSSRGGSTSLLRVVQASPFPPEALAFFLAEAPTTSHYIPTTLAAPGRLDQELTDNRRRTRIARHARDAACTTAERARDIGPQDMSTRLCSRAD